MNGAEESDVETDDGLVLRSKIETLPLYDLRKSALDLPRSLKWIGCSVGKNFNVIR